MTDEFTLTARFVLPVDGPPLPGGTVSVRGDRISAVMPRGHRTADEDLGNVAILPGLVNAHTHLDLSGAAGRIPPSSAEQFTTWLEAVVAYRRSRSAPDILADVDRGIRESLQFGVTLIGDISVGGASWAALVTAPLRAVVFHELIGLDPAVFQSRWAEAVMKNTSMCRSALSPHAPYTMNASGAKRLFETAQLTATHLAETSAEQLLLEHRSGPFVDFLTRMGVYRPDALATSWQDFITVPGRPLASARQLLVHANYLPTDFPFSPNQAVVYCPRTHAAFGHGPHPFPTFQARGVPVALGTDSLASNPDLDVLAEARFLHCTRPDVPAAELIAMITRTPAELLGWGRDTGTLTVGKSADFVAVPLPNRDEDVHELILADHPGARRTMFRGIWR